MTRTVLIVDDDPSFRDAARTLLVARGFRVVGEAKNGAEALALAFERRPEAVLLDVNLPDREGITVAADLSAACGSRVLLTSSDASAASAGVVESCGAAGFLSKENLGGPALSGYLRG